MPVERLKVQTRGLECVLTGRVMCVLPSLVSTLQICTGISVLVRCPTLVRVYCTLKGQCASAGGGDICKGLPGKGG